MQPDEIQANKLRVTEPAIEATGSLTSQTLPLSSETLTLDGGPGSPEQGRASTASESPQLSVGGLAVGERIARYVISAELGAGGMGVVYLARDPELDRLVAIKLIRESTRGHAHASHMNVRLLREAQAMARLGHPNLVHVYEVDVHAGAVFIAMEYVQGLTLSRWVAEHEPSWREIIQVYVQAARGLAAIHRAGLVHRDFKPNNALIDEEGRVRVLDLGLARVHQQDPAPTEAELDEETRPGSPDLTRTGSLLGTPAYMSAEQLRGEVADPRSDQFALCVSLYEALYGQRPFPGEDFDTLRARVLAGQLGPKPQVKAIPEAIYALLCRGLAVDPNQRHPDLEALADGLSRAARRRRPRSWWGAAAAALAIASLAALASWGLTREAPTPAAQAPPPALVESPPAPVEPPPPSAPVEPPRQALVTLARHHDELAFTGTRVAWTLAAQDFAQACAAAPEQLRWCAGAAYAEAKVAQHEGDEERALAGYERAIAIDATWAAPLLGRAAAFNHLGQSEDAQRAALAAQRLEPDWIRAILVGAHVLRGSGNVDEAISELRRALEFAPDEPELLADLALLYHVSGYDSEAVRVGEQTLAAKPSSVPVLVMFAERALETHDPQALEFAERALGVAPKNIPATLARADALLAAGTEAEAQIAFARLLELVAEEPEHGAPSERIAAVKDALAAGTLPPPRHPLEVHPRERKRRGRSSKAQDAGNDY